MAFQFMVPTYGTYTYLPEESLKKKLLFAQVVFFEIKKL